MQNKNNLEKICFLCQNKATWEYMPGFSNQSEDATLRCDNCVPRGCSCMTNSLYIEMCDSAQEDSLDMPGLYPEFDLEIHGLRDDDGRLLPCIEWQEIT